MIESWISGENALKLWIGLFVVAGIGAGIVSGFFKARKIQPKGFRWGTFRNEAIFAVINLATAGVAIAWATQQLTASGIISFKSGPVAWWVIALEYALYFFMFDTWFYWLHRAMHKEPLYKWVHKLHHRSTAPNLLTTFSVSPFESIINGGFVPLFLCVFTVHDATMALIGPTNVLMGLYVHAGYELLPRWWHRKPVTGWFISTSFHDQHHKYFNYNFGGYTTIWDRLCGTVRPKFDADFERRREPPARSPA